LTPFTEGLTPSSCLASNSFWFRFFRFFGLFRSFWPISILPHLCFFKSCWPTALTAHTEPYCKSDSSTQSLPSFYGSQCSVRKFLPSSWSCTQRHGRFEHAPDSSADYSLSVLRSGVGCDIPSHESDSPLLFLSDPSRSPQTDKRYPHEPLHGDLSGIVTALHFQEQINILTPNAFSKRRAISAETEALPLVTSDNVGSS